MSALKKALAAIEQAHAEGLTASELHLLCETARTGDAGAVWADTGSACISEEAMFQEFKRRGLVPESRTFEEHRELVAAGNRRVPDMEYPPLNPVSFTVVSGSKTVLLEVPPIGVRSWRSFGSALHGSQAADPQQQEGSSRPLEESPPPADQIPSRSKPEE